MINQSIMRAFLLGALVVPSVTTAIEEQNKPFFPIEQNRFEKYAPLGAGAAVLAWQLCSGGPFSSYGFNTLGQTIKEHPFKAAGVLSTTVASLWALQSLRSKHQAKPPLTRKKEDLRGLTYFLPFWGSIAINTFLTSSLATPLFVASACSIAAAGLSANIVDSIKDNLEIKHVKKTNKLANDIINERGKQSLNLPNPKSDDNIKNLARDLSDNFTKVDTSQRTSWFSQDTLDLYNQIKPRVVSMNENE